MTSHYKQHTLHCALKKIFILEHAEAQQFFLQLVVRGHARWNWLPSTGNTCNIAILGLGQNEDGHGSTVDSTAFGVGQLCCADGSDLASNSVRRVDDVFNPDG